MIQKLLWRTTLLLLAMTSPLPVLGQDSTASSGQAEALRLYLDCGFCDLDFLRTEIAFVSYVRDRQSAQLHVLVTTQETGGGGTEYVLKFIGLKEFAGVEDELTYVANSTDTQDVVRRGFARVLKLGLVRNVAQLPAAANLDVVYRAGAEQSGAAQQPQDKWNNWVFTLSGNGNFNGQSRTQFSFLNGSVSASRITADWKLQFSVSGSRDQSTFELNDSTTIRSRTSSYFSSALLGRSLGDHWSAGFLASASSSTRDNQDLTIRGSPVVEFSFFKYGESTRRLLTLQYAVSANFFDYADSTIFDKVRETLANHSLTLSLDATQPWGNANIGVSASSFLDDFAKNRLSLFGGGNLRIVKGLNLNIFGSVSRVRDQIFIAKGGITDTDVLLQLKRLQTSFEYFAFVGVSYTFGSIYNNIVNPRLRGLAGGRGFSIRF